jgi:hypothetical protein
VHARVVFGDAAYEGKACFSRFDVRAGLVMGYVEPCHGQKGKVYCEVSVVAIWMEMECSDEAK